MQNLIAQLQHHLPLTTEQVRVAASALLSESESDDAKADFLRALRAKGETAEEIADFAKEFLRHAVNPGLDPGFLPGPALDVCGTGGDRMDLFNVSTTSMFVVAAGGAVLIKHGNRGITSRSGGADVLENLGVKIDLDPADLRRCIETVGLGFIFAPKYHPAFKAVAAVRKRLAQEGIATIFNLLGPLLNPAQPEHQLLGVFSESLLDRFAAVLRILGRKHAWVVHGTAPGTAGVDEFSTMGVSHLRQVVNGTVKAAAVDASLLGLARAGHAELQGGDATGNAAILVGVLDGSIRGPKRDVVLLNAAAGFVVAGLAPDLSEALALAAEQIDSGRGLQKLRLLQAFVQA